MPNVRSKLAAVALTLAGVIVVGPHPVAAACTDAAAPGVDWSLCALTDQNHNGADLTGGNLFESRIVGSVFANVALSNGNLSVAYIENSIFSGANLAGANLSGSWTSLSNFEVAVLTTANIERAVIEFSNHSGANFTGANLSSAHLRTTNFTNANFANAHIDFATITGSNFTGANFTGTTFLDTTVDGATTFMTPPVGAPDTANATGVVQIPVLANDTNVNGVANGRTFVPSAISDPAHGTASTNDSGTVTYIPDSGYSGVDTFTYVPKAIMPAGWTLPAAVAKESNGAAVTVTVNVTATSRVSPITAPWIGRNGSEGRVVRLYGAYFRRNPDQAGFSFWMNQLAAGTWTNARAASFFASSPEFESLYGSGLTDTAFLTLTYRNVFDRLPDSSGQSYWLDRLSKGLSRGEMVLFFSDSPEYRAFTGTN